MSRKIEFKSLPENWSETVIGIMEEGGHLTAVLKAIGISRSIHSKFYEENEEYRETIDKGKLLSEAWWTEQGRANVANKNFNNTLFIFMMKSVFRWKDTYPVTTQGETLANDDEKVQIREKYKNKENCDSESLQ